MTTHSLGVVLTGNPGNLRSTLVAAGRDVQGFAKSVDTAGRSTATTGELMKKGLAVGALAVGAALLYSVNQAAKFDTQLRNLQSLTKQTDTEIGAIGKTLVDMSMRLPQTAETLAAGLYDIASSGFAGADGLKVLEAAAMAASAGLTTTDVSAKAITAVLNAYGLQAEDAADVSDILFKTVDLGVVSFEELAGTIGDVVGTAAAATVAADEMAAAIATMTLSGIGASEAGTSLNRLIQSLLDPSEALAAAMEDLGYQSGAQALQVDDLNVVMEKLRVSSGGNIETLLKWFPEIRAARGALALMSAEGKNYIRVAAGIQDEDARSEATRKALNEQLKAATAQWQLFLNWLNAGAITIGTRVLPVTIGLMGGLKELGSSVIPIVAEGFRRLDPFFSAVADIGEDVVGILGDLAEVAAPVVGALGAIAAVGIITFLNAFAEALSAVSGFLADHPGLVQAVAVVLAAIYLPAVLTSTGATIAGAAANLRYAASFKLLQAQEFLKIIGGRLRLFGEGIAAMTSQMSGGVSAIGKFKGAFAGLGTGLAVGGALVAVTAAVNEYSNQVQEAEEHGKSWARSFAGSFDPAKVSMSELEDEIGRLSGAADEMQEHADNALNPFLDDRLKTARDELRATADPLIQLRDIAKVLQDELGVTADRALELAQDQEFLAGATDGVTGELDAEAAAALEAQDALSELDDQLKAMFDPLFGLQDSMLALQEAQEAAAVATRDHGAASKEAKEANREALRAAVDYQSAIVNLKGAIADGSVNVRDAVETLYAWVDAGILTEDQARQAAREFKGLEDRANAVDGKDVVVTAHANVSPANIALQEFVQRSYVARVQVQLDNPYRRTMGFQLRRAGGVDYAFAGGGMTPAHVARGTTIKYAEPETGGEAYVPRRGDPGRSRAVLDHAASWYGMRVVPMATGGVLTAGPTPGRSSGEAPTVRVVLEPNGAVWGFGELCRDMVRVEGAGSVQVALGQGV